VSELDETTRALAEARAETVELQVEIHKTRLSDELFQAQAEAAELRVLSETLAKRVAQLESALGRRNVLANSNLRGLSRFADLGYRNGDA
jgi:hypothetical protein